jgi:Fur family ferric uptake transcriptional regulator/Fur family peroxide stress response transcriptional regulator
MTDRVDLRVTPQRQAVLDVLRASHDHPTAAEVYERVRAVSPGIGSATVYRTLALLVASGRALQLTLGDGTAARYDANTRRHDHVTCDNCGYVTDIDHPIPSGMVTEISLASGFSITGYDLRLHGTCPSCLASSSDPAPASTPGRGQTTQGQAGTGTGTGA